MATNVVNIFFLSQSNWMRIIEGLGEIASLNINRVGTYRNIKNHYGNFDVSI